jgi:hypothetical protein
MDKLAGAMAAEESAMKEYVGFTKVLGIGKPRAMPPVGVCCPVGAWVGHPTAANAGLNPVNL